MRSPRRCTHRSCVQVYHFPTFWSQRIRNLANSAYISVRLGNAYGESYRQAFNDLVEIGLLFTTTDPHHFSCTIPVEWWDLYLRYSPGLTSLYVRIAVLLIQTITIHWSVVQFKFLHMLLPDNRTWRNPNCELFISFHSHWLRPASAPHLLHVICQMILGWCLCSMLMGPSLPTLREHPTSPVTQFNKDTRTAWHQFLADAL
ncbi:hypothetical protein EI94DRAFT_525738 [Lactarius quietus]|nr:hypothetical protein EI94DRAFT_525738 [Lactarius quietus]